MAITIVVLIKLSAEAWCRIDDGGGFGAISEYRTERGEGQGHGEEHCRVEFTQGPDPRGTLGVKEC